MEIDILKLKDSIDISSVSTDIITRIAEEECAELIQAISKEARGKRNRDNTNEEIADVIICISWLINRLEIDPRQINSWIEYKLNRSKEKIYNGEFN